MCRILLLAVLSFLTGMFSLRAQPGKDGARTITGMNTVVNAYTPLLSTANAGTNTISANITNLNNGAALNEGDLILIIGMQGADMNTTNTAAYGSISNYNSAGSYEFAYVCELEQPTTIGLQSPLSNSYQAGGRHRVQVIKVPQYSSLTINGGASISTPSWNGSSGGVAVVHATSAITVNGSIDVSSLGFRGGQLDNNTLSPPGTSDYVNTSSSFGAEKGESIVGFQSDYDGFGGRYGRGAPANGGGGGCAHNGGGGGGGNGNNGTTWTGTGNPDILGGAGWVNAWNLESAGFANSVSSGGGRGGYSYGYTNKDATTTPPGDTSWQGDYRRNVGGIGGRPLNTSPDSRIFPGGGGGAGDGNDQSHSPGGRGGGIIYLVAPNISGTGFLRANGETALSSTGSGKDALGGGGAGGTVIAKSSVANTISIEANGGNGGNQFIVIEETEGPGGGGGGGFVALAGGSPAISVNGGANGTSNSPSLTEFPPNGATRGASGKIATSSHSFINYSATIASLSASTPDCNTGAITLTASGGDIYIWSTGETSASITTTVSGNYTVTVISSGSCPGTASLSLETEGRLQLIEEQIRAACNDLSNGAINISVLGGVPPYTFEWADGIITEDRDSLSTGNYALTVTDAGNCTVSDIYPITTTYYTGCSPIDSADCQIFLPNAFSPNGDGHNDYFQLFRETGCFKPIVIQIFNRWGEKVFESYDFNFKWDGTYKGVPQGPQVFVWLLRYTAGKDKNSGRKQGSVTLIR